MQKFAREERIAMFALLLGQLAFWSPLWTDPRCRDFQTHQTAPLGLPQWCDQQFKKPRSILFFGALHTSLCNAWQAKCISGFLLVGVQRVLRAMQLHGKVTHIASVM